MSQPKYLEKAKRTYAFHRAKLLGNDKWTATQTADILGRSIGSVTEDLLIARWCRTHEKQLEKIKYCYQALEFIREKQRELGLEKIE